MLDHPTALERGVSGVRIRTLLRLCWLLAALAHALVLHAWWQWFAAEHTGLTLSYGHAFAWLVFLSLGRPRAPGCAEESRRSVLFRAAFTPAYYGLSGFLLHWAL